MFIVFFQEKDYYTTPEVGGIYETLVQAKDRVLKLYSELLVKQQAFCSRHGYSIWINEYTYGDVLVEEGSRISFGSGKHQVYMHPS